MARAERLSSIKTFEGALTMQQAVDMVMVRGVTAVATAREMGIGRTQVFKLLADARKSGLSVSLDLERFIHPLLPYQPAIDLVKKYQSDGLEIAEVVEVPSQLSSPGGFNPTFDYYLQRTLARTGYLRGMIRDGDYIGVGGGQAPHYLAEHFIETGYPSKDCTVIPLERTNRWSKPDPHSAKLVAATLAIAVGGQVADNGGAMITAVTGLENPSLTQGYFDHSPHKHLPDNLASALSELKEELQDFSEQVQKAPFFHPLLGFLQRIEVITPPESLQHLLPEGKAARLRELAEVVNSYAYSIDLNDFKQIYARIGIAGGLHRTFQIWAAIKMGLINRLVTDRPTAEALLRLADGENPFIAVKQESSRARIAKKRIPYLNEAEAAFLEEAQKFAKEHTDQPINLAAIAKNLGFTRAYASLLYKQLAK